MTKFKVGDTIIVRRNMGDGIYSNLCGAVGVIAQINENCIYPYQVTITDRCVETETNGYLWFNDSEIDLFHEICFSNKNNEEENKNMYRNSDVLDLYFDKENAKIDKKYQEKERKIRKKDPVIGQIEAFKTQMKDVKGLKIDYEYDVPQEIREKLIVLRNDENNERDKLHELCREIRTMVQACETYEQHQAILKAYGIIDEQGKLVK